MESGEEFSAPQDTATVRVAEERRSGNKHRNHWWLEDNWPRLKEALVNSRYPSLRGQCDEACLWLGFDPVPKQTVFNVLQRISRSPSTYDNAFSVNNRALLSEKKESMWRILLLKETQKTLGCQVRR